MNGWLKRLSLDTPAPAARSPVGACHPLAHPHPRVQVTAGWEAGADIGPVISPEAKQRIERLIESGIREVGGWGVHVLGVC